MLVHLRDPLPCSPLPEPKIAAKKETRAIFPGKPEVRPPKGLAMVKELSLRTQHCEFCL